MTHLNILEHAYDKHAGYDNFGTFQIFATALPALQYVEMKRRKLDDDHTFALERKADGSYAAYKKVDLTSIMDTDNWGEFYHGAGAN